MIRRELGDLMRRAGGFTTIRDRDENGTVQGFDLASADGYGPRYRFLDLMGPEPEMDVEIFCEMGTAHLRRAGERSFAVLDEIGGVELLDETFVDALAEFLRGSQPCIGVMKGPGPAGKLVEMMGLTVRYELARRALYEHLRTDPDTLLLETTGADDEYALNAVREWVAQYAQ
jgi:nucleoside-triphosphatase THEP1